jgi:hypothetical protein
VQRPGEERQKERTECAVEENRGKLCCEIIIVRNSCGSMKLLATIICLGLAVALVQAYPGRWRRRFWEIRENAADVLLFTRT